MRDHMGAEGECDLRDLGVAVFWPMTEALFGAEASKEKHPDLYQLFDDIDTGFPKAIRGKKIPAVVEGVEKANVVFRKMLDAHHAAPAQCPVGPIMSMYDRMLGPSKAPLTCQFATSAWWGGQGNTVPATMWTFAQVLADEKWRRMAYAEVDQKFTGPDAQGKIDFEQLDFLTAALKETLRLKTFSVAWRIMNEDTVVKTGSGQEYLLKKNSALGVHWVLRHMDPTIYADAHQFRPTRFLNGQEENRGVPWSWAPFSAGTHKCSGYSLAILEIPVVMAYMLREYDMEVLDSLPGMDWSASFGLVGADGTACRIRYKRRR